MLPERTRGSSITLGNQESSRGEGLQEAGPYRYVGVHQGRGEAREHSPRPRPGRRWGTGQETGRGTEWPLVGASQRLEEWGGAVSPTGPTGPTGLSVAFGL